MAGDCPTCGAVLQPSSRFCAGCGSAVLRPFVPGAEGAPCAVHGDLRAVAACPRCGSFACPRCLTIDARGGERCAACVARASDDVLPWDRRAEIGWIHGYYATVLRLLQAPSATFAAARPEGSVASSCLFALLSGFAATFTTGLVYAVAVGGMMFFVAAGESNTGPSPALLSAGIGLGMVALFGVVAPVVGAGFTLLGAALDHLILRLVGARPRPWPVTLRARSLSLAPYLVGLVPICGMYVFPIWALVLRVFAYRSFHRTSGPKAAAAALIVPIGLFLAIVAGYVALLVATSAAGGE